MSAKRMIANMKARKSYNQAKAERLAARNGSEKQSFTGYSPKPMTPQRDAGGRKVSNHAELSG